MNITRILVITLLLTLVFALGAFGQTATTAIPSEGPVTTQTAAPPQLYNTVIMAGGGLQPQVATTGNYQASGFTGVCVKAPDLPVLGLKVPNYVCQATDYFGTATAARIDSEGVLLNKSVFAGGWKTGAGAAHNANGTGVSLTLGGWGAVRIDKLTHITGSYFMFSGTWQKDDVTAFVQGATSTLPAQLRTLGARGVYRIGFSKGLN